MSTFYVSTAIDICVGAAVLLGPSLIRRSNRRPVSLAVRRLVLVCLAVLVSLTIKAERLFPGGVDFWGLLHLIYLTLVITLPSLGALAILYGVAASRRETRALSRPVWILSALALSLAGVGVYASLIEPSRLQLERTTIEIPRERAGVEALRLGVLADLQTDRITAHEDRAFEMLKAAKPDIILIPGDLFQGTEEDFQRELPALRSLIAGLQAPGGVFFVTGNTDHSRHDLERVFNGSAVQLLYNEVVSVIVKDRRVTIGGIDAQGWGNGTGRVLERLESSPDPADYRILVSHYPDVVLRLKPQTRIDLVVAGHTHGGQVQLPLFGPPLTLSAVPRKVGAGGYHVLEGRGIYVSRGVGMERGQAPRIRFLCPPEVSLLLLEPASP